MIAAEETGRPGLSSLITPLEPYVLVRPESPYVLVLFESNDDRLLLLPTLTSLIDMRATLLMLRARCDGAPSDPKWTCREYGRSTSAVLYSASDASGVISGRNVMRSGLMLLGLSRLMRAESDRKRLVGSGGTGGMESRTLGVYREEEEREGGTLTSAGSDCRRFLRSGATVRGSLYGS
jgi:hypothetical protein